MLPRDIAAGQNATEGIRCKSYSEVVIEAVRRRARTLVGASIARKTDRVLNKGDDMVVCFPGAKTDAITERVDEIINRAREDLF